MTAFAAAIERVLRAELERLKAADLAKTPALKLSDLQLAVGCAAETPVCLDQIAKQLEIQAIVYANVNRAGDEKVLAISLFEARTGRDPKRVLRRAAGESGDDALLEMIEPMVRELYGLPPTPVEP